MKRITRIVLILLAIISLRASAQPPRPDVSQAQETQVRGYWVDPSSNLMWAGKDNGRDVSWKKAMKYCRDLRLAGYADWRLAALTELEAIYDKDAESPGLDGQGASTWHVKGNLFLT